MNKEQVIKDLVHALQAKGIAFTCPLCANSSSWGSLKAENNTETKQLNVICINCGLQLNFNQDMVSYLIKENK